MRENRIERGGERGGDGDETGEEVSSITRRDEIRDSELGGKEGSGKK